MTQLLRRRPNPHRQSGPGIPTAGLTTLGVDEKRVYVDHCLTGTNRDRPGLREALPACREGDTLVVTMLDHLARSVPDACDIVDELTNRGVRLNTRDSVHVPTGPIGRLLFTVLSMITEFEADLASAPTREGLAVAKAKGRQRGQAAQAQAHPGSAPCEALASRLAIHARPGRAWLQVCASSC